MPEADFFEAHGKTWIPMANTVTLLDVLSRLEPTGVFLDLRSPTEAAAVAERTGLTADVVEQLLRFMELSGVVRSEGGTYVLTEGWMALTGPGAFMPLATLIAGQRVSSKVLSNLGNVSYWDLPTADRLAMAISVSPDPYSDALVAAYRTGMGNDPVGQAQLRGGRFLELGCGVAGRVLLTLRASPEMSAVGVELSEDLAAEAERRAIDLGLSDRFTVICGDAAAYVADEPFDFGFWSQFFFPDEGRAGALRVMLASLRPGASFVAPIGADPDAVSNDPEAAKEEAAMHAMLRAWGVPGRTVDELCAEVEAAGFSKVEVIAREVGPAVRGWKPRQ